MRQTAPEIQALFEYLEDHGIKQSWLAERLGMTRQYLYHVRLGLVPTPTQFVRRACRELDISPRRLGASDAARRRAS